MALDRCEGAYGPFPGPAVWRELARCAGAADDRRYGSGAGACRPLFSVRAGTSLTVRAGGAASPGRARGPRVAGVLWGGCCTGVVGDPGRTGSASARLLRVVARTTGRLASRRCVGLGRLPAWSVVGQGLIVVLGVRVARRSGRGAVVSGHSSPCVVGGLAGADRCTGVGGWSAVWQRRGRVGHRRLICVPAVWQGLERRGETRGSCASPSRAATDGPWRAATWVTGQSGCARRRSARARPGGGR